MNEVQLFDDFHEQAKAFCELIETHATLKEEDFITKIARYLARLYGAGLSLASEDAPEVEDFAERSKTWQSLDLDLEPYLVRTDQFRRALWAYPEREDMDETAEGCLSSNLLDIYVFLKPDLNSDAIRFRAQGFAQSPVGQRAIEALWAMHQALHDEFIFVDWENGDE